MENTAQIFLKCKGNEIFVECKIAFDEPVTNFSFSINSLLIVDNISGNVDTEFRKGDEWKHNPYAPEQQEYIINAKTALSTVTINYHGKVWGWCNAIEEHRIALSDYSGWFLARTNAPLYFKEFVLLGMEDYYVINAKFHNGKKEWRYNSDEGYDAGNIIAFKKGEYYKASAGNFSFYYINKAEEVRGSFLVHYYNEIIKFYNKIFGNTEIKKFDVVSLGIMDGIGGGAAYFRKELIVSERMDYDLDNEKDLRINTASFLSHELAHNWFSGASHETWEDWLNETGATWASLLYALDIKYDALFQKILNEADQAHKSSLIIKPSDLKRPENVHGSGVMLLYEIYKKYGAEPILAFLSAFIEIKEKNTENLLASLRNKIGDEIPLIVQKGLTMEDYSKIC